MFEASQSPAPTPGGPMPPWRQQPTNPPQPPASAVPAPAAIPGPWSRPAAARVPAPAAPTAPSTPAGEAPKDWGPIKPIRAVPKPDEQKVAYVLAQTEHVVNPEAEHTRKKWIIIGSIAAFAVIAGGSAAFIFFGRNTQRPILSNEGVYMVNTRPSNGNAGTNGVFPDANVNGNANASNANTAAADADGDGLSDADEARYGSSTTKTDTDGDGFTDGEEVRNGYNPNGAGKL